MDRFLSLDPGECESQALNRLQWGEDNYTAALFMVIRERLSETEPHEH
jgi:hypothetical protein